MTDLRTQRNVAIGAAAVVLAVLVGFLVGRGTGGGSPAESATPSPVADAPSNAAQNASPAATSLPAPVPATARPAAPASDARPRANRPAETAPAAGQRWNQNGDPAVDPTPRAGEASPPTPRPVVMLTVPDGTPISLALTAPLSSQSTQPGDAVEAELTEAIEVGGRVALPTGTRLTGRVSEAHALKKVGGQARLAFSLDTAIVDGREVPIEAHFAREGKSETGKDAATIAAGTAIGIILGNQAKKNDRGKVIGGVLGGAAGTGVAAATKGETIELPAGTELRLTLRQAVTVTR